MNAGEWSVVPVIVNQRYRRRGEIKQKLLEAENLKLELVKIVRIVKRYILIIITRFRIRRRIS
jgi:hypothetical protein